MNTKLFGAFLMFGLSASAWAATPVDIELGQSLLIDDFTDTNKVSKLGPWDIYDDGAGETTLKISYETNAGVDGTSNAIRADYTLNGYSLLDYNPFIEFNAYLSSDGLARDLSSCNEIQYDYRGNVGHYFKVKSDINVADNYHREYLDPVKAWKTAVIHWNDLYQGDIEYWGIEANIDSVQKHMRAFMWQVQEEDGTSGYLEIANVRCFNKPSYTVKFMWGDSVLCKKELLDGDYPSCNVYELANERYRYYTDGWSPAVTNVKEDITYQAVVTDSTERLYEISFKNQFGDQVMWQEMKYGEMPVYAGIDPVRVPSVGYTYKFMGWGKQVCEKSCMYWKDKENGVCYDFGWNKQCHAPETAGITSVTEDAVYVPVYDSTAIPYNVKFVDYDGTVLSQKKYDYGTSFLEIEKPAAPTRENKGDTVYTFNGWMPYLDYGEEDYCDDFVENNTVFVATYQAQVNTEEETYDVERYTVAFVYGDSVVQIGEYESGDKPEVPNYEPFRDSTIDHIYSFKYWGDPNCWWDDDGCIEHVYEDKIYMALFDEQYRKYWIVIKDDEGAVADSVQFEYGDEIESWIVRNKSTNLKSYEDGYSFDDDCWTPTLARVTGRAVYQLSYRYRVRFIDETGRDIEQQWLKKGETPDCMYCNTKRNPTEKYTYEFIGWNKEYTPVTDTTTYMAVYKATPVPAAVNVDIAEGKSLLIDDFEDGDEVSALGTAWFTYNDNDYVYDVDDNGDSIYYKSQVSNMVALNGDKGNVLKIYYKRDCEETGMGYGHCRGWFGSGVRLVADEVSSLDLSQCNAIQYDYRGPEHEFRIQSVYDEGHSYIETETVAETTWTTRTVYRSDFWNDENKVDLAFSHATDLVWHDMYGNVEGVLEIDNIRCVHKPSYTIMFYDGETLLDSAVYIEGKEPYYNGPDTWGLAQERGDEQNSYEFAGWSPELGPVAGDTRYEAQFEKTPRTYRICFNDGTSYYGKGGYYDYYDDYGNCQDVEYGKMPEYSGTPTKNPDNYCNKYEFVKWTSWSCDDEYGECTDVEGFVPVTENRTYEAKFTCVDTVYYTVTFMNDNDTVLWSQKFRYGDWVNDWYVRPTKEPSGKYEYEFDSWTPEVESYVTGNATYTAQYREVPRQLKVRFVDGYDNTVWVNDEFELKYPYGTPYSEIAMPDPEYVPEKYSWSDTQYVFTGWNFDPTSDEVLKSDLKIEPKFSKKYAVRFKNYNGNSLISSTEDYYAEGTPLSEIARPEDPTQDDYVSCYDTDGDYEEDKCDTIRYSFAGWLPAVADDAVLTGPMTFTSSFKASDGAYTVAFMNGDDIIYTTDVAKGEMPEFIWYENPYKYENDEFTYTWDSEDGWEPKLAPVTGPAVYHAKFVAKRKTFEVVFVNDDGTELYRNTYEYGATITDAPTEAQVVKGKTGEFEYSDEWCEYSVDTSYVWDEDWNPVLDENGDPIREIRKNKWCYNGLQPVTRNITYIANVRYKVEYLDGDGEFLSYDWYQYGYVPEAPSWVKPTKTSSISHNYQWNGGWSPAVDTVKGGKQYTALFDSTLRMYEVAFEDEDGTVLKEAVEYEYGTTAEAIETPADPKKAATETTVYTFAGWSLNRVTGNVTYKASYKESPRMYLVSFVGDDGETIVDTARYEYNTPVEKIVVPNAPAKEGFKFTGWIPEIADVNGDAEYKATYIEDTKFTITWLNDDGSVLLKEIYNEGSVPKYSGEKPTKESTAEFEYVANGWTPAVDTVKKDVEYTATYTAKKRSYIVKFVNYEGTLLDSAVYAYGTTVDQISIPEVPGRESNEVYTYTFAGWYPMVEDVTGDVTYTALFGNNKRIYTVAFLRENGEDWSNGRYYYNEVVDIPSYGPSKWTPECEYEFDKWLRTTGASDTVKSDMVYTAAYSSKCIERKYYVEFYDPIRGDWEYRDNLAYGTKKDSLEVPEIRDTIIDGCSYKFTGWNPEVTDVVKSVDYMAQYEKTCDVQYEVTWLSDDGTQLGKEKYNIGEMPSYKGTPAKASSEKYSYRFSGWTPTIVEVTENASYTATFDSTFRLYDIMFVDRFEHEGFVDGELVVQYRYGTKASAIVTPTLDAVVGENCTYTFAKWDKTIADVTGDAVYVAEYDSVCKEPPVPPSSSSETPVVSSSSEQPVVSSSSETPVVSSSSVKPPVSSSSEPPVVSSSSETPVVSSSSEQPVVSSSSETPVVSSSSVKPPVSSSSETPVVSSSSETPVVSSSSEQPVVSSSSETPVVSSSSVKPPVSSSSETPVVSSSSEQPVVSSSSEAPVVSSSSKTPASSSSSKTPAGSSSSKTPASSSSKTPASSSSKGGKSSSSGENTTLVMDNLQNHVKLGFANRTLTVVLASPATLKVQVFDMNGLLLDNYSEYVVSSRDFDLNDLKPGNYIVRVSSSNNRRAARISIK